MLVLLSHGVSEDEMCPNFTGEIAAQRSAELHQQAARQRMLRWLRAAGPASQPNSRLAGRLVRVGFPALLAGH